MELMSLSVRPGGQVYWDKAIADGWIPGKTLFRLRSSKERNNYSISCSDAAQMMLWPKVKANLKKGDAFIFLMVFNCYKDQTGVIPPDFVDIIMVAPKGSVPACAGIF